MLQEINISRNYLTLQQYWNDQAVCSCRLKDNEKGAGTMSPYTSSCHWSSRTRLQSFIRRPADGRYGGNPKPPLSTPPIPRVAKPSPSNIQGALPESLEN